MMQAKFASLALFEQNLEFKASLLDTRVDSQLLHNLEPSPAQVFREAHELDGASTDDIRLFLKALKEIKGADNHPLVTRDGLDMLTNVLWDMTWKERNTAKKDRAHEPRKQPRHTVRESALTWPCGMDVSQNSKAGSMKAKRKAPAGCIDHANTHSPGLPMTSIGTTSTEGHADAKLREAFSGKQVNQPGPKLGTPNAPPLSEWLKKQEVLMAAKRESSTLSTWLTQQRALMAAGQHVSTESEMSAHSGPDCSDGTGMGTVAINERAGKASDTADSSDKLKGSNSPYVMLMASMKAAMSDAEFQKVKMSVMQYRQSRDVKQFARKLVAAVRCNPSAQSLLPQLAAVVPRNEREVFKAHLHTLIQVLPRIELGLALLSPSQKEAVSELGAMAVQDTANPSTDGTNQTTEDAITPLQGTGKQAASPPPVDATTCQADAAPAAAAPAATDASPSTLNCAELGQRHVYHPEAHVGNGGQRTVSDAAAVTAVDTTEEDVGMCVDDKMVT